MDIHVPGFPVPVIIGRLISQQPGYPSMFDNLTERLSRTIRNLRGQGRLTEDNIKETLREVRMALLEADVAVPVVKAFTDAVRVRALGEEVSRSLTPGQAFVKIIHDELVAVMGEPGAGLNLRAQPPVVVLLAGLQGAGKTTTAAKLARHLREKDRKKVLLASTDVYRPAAMTQLERLAAQVDCDYFAADPSVPPVEIAQSAVAHARRHLHDVVIVDTAGRLHVDDDMMAEVKAVDRAIEPLERLFVVDSMAGQDAVNAARAFNDALALTGVILTKADGDARGGAALSVRHVTGKPILFLGVGEKTEALEPFHPERVASRILGMGDVIGLIEKAESAFDQAQAEEQAEKLIKGDLTFEDFAEQLSMMRKMGPVGKLLDMLPSGLGGGTADVDTQIAEQQLLHTQAIIQSMTPKERRKPEILNASRKRRIARGSGTTVQEVNQLLRQFKQMRRMFKQMSKRGISGVPTWPR